MRSDAPTVDYFIHKTGFGVITVLIACVKLLAGVVLFHSIVITVIAFAKRSDPRSWITAFRAHWPSPGFEFSPLSQFCRWY